MNFDAVMLRCFSGVMAGLFLTALLSRDPVYGDWRGFTQGVVAFAVGVALMRGLLWLVRNTP